MKYDKLIQKYLRGESTQQDKDVLLDYFMKGTNEVFLEVRKIKELKK